MIYMCNKAKQIPKYNYYIIVLIYLISILKNIY